MKKRKSQKEKFNIMANNGDAISITTREGKVVVVASQTYTFKTFKLVRLDPNVAVVIIGNFTHRVRTKKLESNGGYMWVTPFQTYRFVLTAPTKKDYAAFTVRAKDNVKVNLDLAITSKITNPKVAIYDYVDVFDHIRIDLQNELVNFAYNRTNEEITRFRFDDLDGELKKLQDEQIHCLKAISDIEASSEHQALVMQKIAISNNINNLVATRNANISTYTQDQIETIDRQIEAHKLILEEINKDINTGLDLKKQELESIKAKIEDIGNLKNRLKSFSDDENGYGVEITEISKQAAGLEKSIQEAYDKQIVSRELAEAKKIEAEGEAAAIKLRAEGNASAIRTEGQAKAEVAGMMFDALSDKCDNPELISKTLLALSGKLDGLAVYTDGESTENKVLAKTLGKITHNNQ